MGRTPFRTCHTPTGVLTSRLIRAHRGAVEEHPRNRYTVTAEPDGQFWLIRIQERPDLLTQARHAGEIELMARDLIAVSDAVPHDSFDLVLPDVDDRLIRSEDSRGQAT